MSRAITTEVYVDLDDFDTDELIAELKLRIREMDWREKETLIALAASVSVAFETELDRATHELMLGRREEAIVWLERALPREWAGRLK